MTRKQDSIRGVEQEQENDEEQQDLKEDSADRSPLNEIKENAQSRAQEESLRTIYRNNLKKILDRQFEPNGYPENLMSHVAREFLKVESYKPKEEGTTAEYLPDTDTKCVFCFKAVDSSGDAELMPCQGQMGSIEKRKIACRSKFHANCAIKYNAGSFLFQYSALPECQGKLQCPLHCCSLCNNEHYKQVAYAGEMTECALCLRAFHKELCIPAGSKNLDVEIKIEGRGVQFEMIVCPAHFTKKKTGKHIAACDECQNTKDLIKCSTCVRSFHKECQDVKTLDGQPIPADKCEKCLAGDAVRYDVPVLVRWSDNIFYLGITRNWFSYPNYDRARSRIYDVVGYTVVEWILELREEGKKLKKQQQFTVCAISDLAPVVEPYLRLAPANTKDLWQKTADATDIYARLPTLYREVDKKLQTSRYAEKTLKKYTPCYETALCKCIGENRCTTEDCCFVASGFECPADCEENGQICNNRKISKKFVNPNITQRKAGRKGYGVFACGKIKKGEFLAEYVGEIINREERIRRRYIADNSADFQASHYIMEMAEGYAVDAARVGNISRYINHSCEPNARAQVFKSLITKTERKDNKKDYIDYEYRLGIVATKDIGVDEEVTFNYQMGDRNKSITDIPKCYCGTPSCTGYLTTRPTEGEDGENEKSYVAEYGREKRSSRKDFKPRSKKIEKQKTLKRKSAVTFNLNDEESPVKRRCSAPAPSRSVGRPKKNIEKVNGEKKERRHTILEGIEAYDTKIEIKEEEEEEEEMTLLTSSEPSDISIRRSSRGHVPKNKFQIDN